MQKPSDNLTSPVNISLPQEVLPLPPKSNKRLILLFLFFLLFCLVLVILLFSVKSKDKVNKVSETQKTTSVSKGSSQDSFLDLSRPKNFNKPKPPVFKSIDLGSKP